MRPTHRTRPAASIAKSFASGSKKAILLGAAVVRHPQYAQLLASARSLADATGATLGFLTEAANTVGSHLVDAFPIADGLNAAAMLDDPRRAYVLLGVEPELDLANPPAAVAALRGAELVVALTSFKQRGRSACDVMLPISPFTETSGTFVNCEGRAQSFNGAVKPRGDTRPAWKVLRVLGNLLGLRRLRLRTSEAVRTEITGGAVDLSSRCVARAASGNARRVGADRADRRRPRAHGRRADLLLRSAGAPLAAAASDARRGAAAGPR